jgi:hypothetical protein
MNRLALMIVLAVAVQLACGGAGGVKTGDETRSGAVEIALGGSADDKVASSGDAVDWKRFTLDDSTSVTVSIHWDNPDIKATVFLRDMFGAVVVERTHAPGTRKDELADVRLKEGSYFLEIRADKGASVYTIEVVPADGIGSYGIPRPE